MGSKVLKKSVTYPMGVSSEATWRVYFVRTVSPVPKYTLRVASELTPREEVTLFFNTLHSKGAQGIHRFGPLWPKMAKKCSKRGYPLFWPVFQEDPGHPPYPVAEI